LVLQVIICLPVFVFTAISLNGVLHFICATNDRLRLSELKSQVVNGSLNLVVASLKYAIVTGKKATVFWTFTCDDRVFFFLRLINSPVSAMTSEERCIISELILSRNM